MPDQSGVYVYAMLAEDQTVLVVLNGSGSDKTIDMERFREVTGKAMAGRDVISDKKIDISSSLAIKAGGVYVLDLEP